jgi:MoaA/NifB/PqqE/SkfB family radical SAM enzyme
MKPSMVIASYLSNKTPEWADTGSSAIRQWYLDRHGKNGELDAAVSQRVAACIQSNCSRPAFYVADIQLQILNNLLGGEGVTGKAGAVVGCEWGLSSLYLADQGNPRSLVALDLSSGFSDVASKVVELSGDRFSAVRIAKNVSSVRAATGENLDFVLVTTSLNLPTGTVGQRRVDQILGALAVGGVAILMPNPLEGRLSASEAAEAFAAAGFVDIAFYNAKGQTVAEASAYYVAGKKATAPDNAVGSNYVEKGWLPDAVRQIEAWYQASDYVNVAHIRGGDPKTMVKNTITSFTGRPNFDFVDTALSTIARRAGAKGLQNQSGVVFGSDWGFSVLHIAETWQPGHMLGVDVTGKFSGAGRAVQSLHEGLFSNVEFIDAGPGRMNKYAGQKDFLFITRSYSLLDTYLERKEFVRVIQVLKDGGWVVLQPDLRPGQIAVSDIVEVLQAAGCEDISLHQHNGATLKAGTDKGFAFITAQKRRTIKPSEADAALDQSGQGADALLARRPRIVYPKENILERLQKVAEEIQQGKSVLKTLPLRYTMNVLSVCNIKCIFCDYPDRLRHWTLPESFLSDVIDTLDGTLRVQLTGGETLMSQQSREMLEVARRMPFLQMEVITNMTLEKEGLMDLVQRGASFVTCSMDAATEPTYDKIRQDSDFPRVVRNLKELVRLRNESGAHHPHVQINFIIMGHNYREIAQFIDLAKEIGADSVAYKWLLWTLTPRITEEARFPVKDETAVRSLCEQIIEAERRSRMTGVRIVWGPVPFHLMSEMKEWYDEYDLRGVFNAPPIPWRDPKRIFAKKPRVGTAANISPGEIADALAIVDVMPDGLMPCSAPFTTMQMNGPKNANFCCYSTAEYRNIPVDATGGLLDAWNHPKFVEARRYFHEGKYEKVCRLHCSLYQAYLDAKREGRRVAAVDVDITDMDSIDMLRSGS